jgi:hypothetical protein
MGNIIELCAFELYPDPKISLGFTMCITRDYGNIPDRDLIEDCALEHAIDVKALNDCAAKGDGAHGIDMLRRSVMRTKEVRPVYPPSPPQVYLFPSLSVLTNDHSITRRLE